jgi:hypothetical protein
MVRMGEQMEHERAELMPENIAVPLPPLQYEPQGIAPHLTHRSVR